jgi:hypothetical protein
MSDIITVITIKNMARKMVKKATAKNADETLFFKFPDQQRARGFLSKIDFGLRDQYSRLNRNDMTKVAVLIKDKFKEEKSRIVSISQTFQGAQIDQTEYLK